MKQLILLIAALILVEFQTDAAIRYVTTNGSGALNGTSWTNAYPGDSLQLAINESAAGDEVWVAQGTYYPTTTADRSTSFNMKNDVSIYGSFTGTETLLSQRDLTSGLTSVLSGEIGAGGISDNSYHVFSNNGLNNTAIIDGFIVRDANDDRPAGLNVGLGGGFYNDGSGGSGMCNPTIRNCVIQNNQAVFGAGIFNNGYDGGNASPLLVNCVITDNLATTGGGGIDNFGLLNGNASPTLLNCVIYNNSAVQRAGGMYCWGGNDGNASPVMVNTCFVNNSAVDGGGIVADRLNASTGSSGTSAPELKNCIFWGNTVSGTGPQFFLLGGASFNPTYSNIDLSNQTTPHIPSGTGVGNIQLNPIFADILSGVGPDGEWMTPDDGLRLQSSSPCINTGDNSGTSATDILSESRIKYSTVDMGAYEFDSTSLLSVAENNPLIQYLLVSPNPYNRSVKLTYNLDEAGPVYLSLLDLSGKLLWCSDQGKQIKGSYQLEIDWSLFENGTYLLNLETEKGTSTQRVIKTD